MKATVTVVTAQAHRIMGNDAIVSRHNLSIRHVVYNKFKNREFGAVSNDVMSVLNFVKIRPVTLKIFLEYSRT
jgi:hypothetical protein